MKSKRFVYGWAPIGPSLMLKFLGAIDSFLEAAENPEALKVIDPINFSELKGIFNRPIKKDTWDHERLWNYLGKPDAAVSKPITRHLYVIGRSLRCGDLATAKRRLEILKTPEFIEQLIVLRGHLMNHYNGREDYEVGI